MRGEIVTRYRVELTGVLYAGEKVVVTEPALTLKRPRGTSMGPVVQPARASRQTWGPRPTPRLAETPVWDRPTQPGIPPIRVGLPPVPPEVRPEQSYLPRLRTFDLDRE